MPVCLGGKNNKENLIYLTARDHYFAHCCLAKAYGGKMWSALWAMASMTKKEHSRNAFSRRKMYEVCKQRFSKNNSDRLKKEWTTGFERKKRIWSPSDAHKKSLSEKMKGRKMPEAAVIKSSETRRRRAGKFKLVHIETGEIICDYPRLLRDRCGLSQSLLSFLLCGKIRQAKGWLVYGTDPKSVYGRNPKIFKFQNSDGRTFEGTIHDLGLYDPSIESCGISRLLNGKLKTHRGWKSL